jgi:hypothetical protein
MRLVWDAEGKKFGTHELSPELIEELIADLDNEARTLVALDARGQSCMMVIGGQDGRVRVNHIPENLDTMSRHLIDPDGGDGTIRLKTNGKLTSYHLEHTVDKHIAVRALVDFAQYGDLSPELAWQDDT